MCQKEIQIDVIYYPTKEFYDWQEFLYNTNLSVIKLAVHIAFPQTDHQLHVGRLSYSSLDPSTLDVQKINTDTIHGPPSEYCPSKWYLRKPHIFLII